MNFSGKTSVLLLSAVLIAQVGAQEIPSSAAKEEPSKFAVEMEVNAAKPLGELKPIWRFFGADEPNYATMKDGQKLLGELGELAPKQVYFRTHNLLCTGDGTPALKWGSTNIYTEDAGGNPVYDWTIVDAIFDSYLQRGVRPYVQLGFMPQAMSIHPEPYQHHWKPGLDYSKIVTGWAYPPKDYDRWRELAYQWTKHCLERYGRSEVEHWYWEVWNEPNGSYWKGTPEEFQKLCDYAYDGIRRALPNARIGGAHTAGDGGKFHRDFLEHCIRGTDYATGKVGTDLDFISFHAKGGPKFIDGHVQMGIANQLNVIDRGFALAASYPELKSKPIVIGESDPDGCAACQGPQLGYRNTTMYSSYTAASFARKYQLADKHGVNLEGAVTWAFEFENQPWFAGFRVLATNGIDLPVMNVFRMFSKMSGQRMTTTSSSEIPLAEIMKNGVRGKPDVGVLSSLDAERKKLSVLIWHYHDDDLPGPEAEVSLVIRALPISEGEVAVQHFRIDSTHSNSFTAWQRMGSPSNPNAGQYAELEKAGRLEEWKASEKMKIAKGSLALKFELPRQAVSLIVLDWK